MLARRQRAGVVPAQRWKLRMNGLTLAYPSVSATSSREI